VPPCTACGGTQDFLGIQPIHMGGAGGGWVSFFGDIAEGGEWLWDVAILRCGHCDRFDFYDKDSPLAQHLKS
jgi:hypothetical protein